MWIPDSRYLILDSSPWWDSEFLELYPGSQSPGFQIPQVKISWIPDTTSKNFPDSRIWIPYHEGTKKLSGFVLLKSTERQIESIPRRTLQRFTNLEDFSDNSTVGVTSTDNLQKRDRRRVGRPAFLICQIGEKGGTFHLLCKYEMAKLLPIKSEKKNCKNTT